MPLPRCFRDASRMVQGDRTVLRIARSRDVQVAAASCRRRQEHASGLPSSGMRSRVIGEAGVEPATPGFMVLCSTIELLNAWSEAVRTRVAEHAPRTALAGSAPPDGVQTSCSSWLWFIGEFSFCCVRQTCVCRLEP